MPAGSADKLEKIMKYGSVVIASVNESYIGFNNLDLTGIEKIAFTATAPSSQLNVAGGMIEVRLGSPTGKLIGNTAMISPAEVTDQANMPPPVEAKITGVTGFHNVYFVFKNEEAPSGQSLFVVIDLEFQTAKSAAYKSASAAPKKQVSADDLKAYAGKYKMTGLPFEHVEIFSKEEKLIMNAGGNEGILSPGQEVDVFTGDNGTEIHFGRNDNKKVDRIILKAQGFTFEGNKE
ncbi:hypothetical protein BH23BAC1_BH23BAC1_43660 [soil metagenome]